eukprot:scaffold5442_cov26-Prasinocladus_malaysianus.AAC.2
MLPDVRDKVDGVAHVHGGKGGPPVMGLVGRPAPTPPRLPRPPLPAGRAGHPDAGRTKPRARVGPAAEDRAGPLDGRGADPKGR